MEILNIKNLIEKNPITRLSRDYENRLINKVKNNFNDNEQKLFLSSFYCFLNYDSKKDFVIDFDNAWKWCGFSRKDNAKTLLTKHFTNEIDYKVQNTFPADAGKVEMGRPTETIFLNVNTFKKFCLKANTTKAEEVHDYYIKLEEMLQETINEESNELRLQLSNSEEEKKKIEEEKLKVEEEKLKIEEENKKLLKKYVKKEKQIFDKNVVYLMTTDEAEKLGEYAVGKAIDLTRRKDDYNNNKLHDFKVVYYVCCRGPKIMDCLESLILSKLGKYRYKAGRDAFRLPENSDVSLFTDLFETCLKIYDDVDDDDIKYPVATKTYYNKEKAQEYRKKYKAENAEKIKERQRLFYQNNKEIMSILGKIYCIENAEKIAIKRKKYYEEHKDEIIKVNMAYYYEHKDDILEKRKEFYENNKEQILSERQKYYDENYATKIAPKRQELVMCECGLTLTHYCLKKHQKTVTHTERMEHIDEPIVEASKERVKCDCGMVIARSGVNRHLKTERHEKLMKQKQKA